MIIPQQFSTVLKIPVQEQLIGVQTSHDAAAILRCPTVEDPSPGADR